MINFPFLRKSDPELPDNYTVTVKFHDGKEDVYTIVSHGFMIGGGYLEIMTTDERCIVFPATAYRSASFDKNWTKVVECKKRDEKRKLEEKKKYEILEGANGVPS